MVLEELLELPQKLRIMWLIKKGLKLGTGCFIVRSAIIDGSFPWLISIGDNCTITCNVIILAHDASTKKYLGYSKIGAVSIGNNCFVGAGTIILPNVHIGNNVIIGAGSIVTKNIPDNSVAMGTPARVVSTIQEFVEAHSTNLVKGVGFPGKDTTSDKIKDSKELRKIMFENVRDKIGYIE